jgi:hypothetical protein
MPIEIYKNSTALGDYVAEQVEIIRAIPDGIRLANYPTHDETPACWCHPRLVWSVGGALLSHKNLHQGEFDS